MGIGRSPGTILILRLFVCFPLLSLSLSAWFVGIGGGGDETDSI